MGIDKEKLGYFTQAMAALSAAPVASYPESGEYRNALRLQDQTATFTAQAKAKKEAAKAKKKAKKTAMFKTGLGIAGAAIGGPVLGGGLAGAQGGAAIGSGMGDALGGGMPDVAGILGSVSKFKNPALTSGLKPGPDDFLYPSDQNELGTYR